MESFLIRYGPLAVFLGTTLEADAVPVLAGVVAHLGHFNYLTAVVAASLGTFTGDSCWYWLGRHRAALIINNRLYRRTGGKIEHYVKRLGPWQILAARVVYGTRVASMIFWGAQGLSFMRFAAINLLGCAIWATTLVSLGYLLSGSASLIIGGVRRVELWLGGAALVTLTVLLVGRALAQRQARRKESAEPDPS
jgi:membrane protein DedA with SNARE-associated domain